MARPRVFISSTFYDLRQIRGNLNSFVKELGYDPVMNETGSIAYGNDNALDVYCYKEVELCDILIAIIGGRFGTKSSETSNSITQEEIVRAHNLGKQVYIFIDKQVLSEFQLYLANKDNNSVVFPSVDNVKIFDFIEKVKGLPVNNTIHPFENFDDIRFFLKEQWAGLFQRFLQEQTRQSEYKLHDKIEKTALTLDKLVTFLTEERDDKDKAIQEILLSNHPALIAMKKCLHTKMRIFFQNIEEMDNCLEAFGYTNATREYGCLKTHFVWTKTFFRVKLPALKRIIYISRSIFDEHKILKTYVKRKWDESYIRFEEEEVKVVNTEDDLPF